MVPISSSRGTERAVGIDIPISVKDALAFEHHGSWMLLVRQSQDSSPPSTRSPVHSRGSSVDSCSSRAAKHSEDSSRQRQETAPEEHRPSQGNNGSAHLSEEGGDSVHTGGNEAAPREEPSHPIGDLARGASLARVGMLTASPASIRAEPRNTTVSLLACNHCGFLPAAARESAETVSKWLTVEVMHCCSGCPFSALEKRR
eukprot:gene9789-biopygen3357